ncbi:MAG: aminotransferase class V-fold PLP-dependent enzyme [Desulfurococcales archaeon]|nr:aminotransferase class V-fold PLP-dependent enzyme [Desulfurococcales archaeon]
MGTQVIGGMIPDPPWPAREACAKWAHTNKGDLDSYLNLREVHDDVVRRFSNIVFGSKYPGMMTSGATESNILALLYWRKQGKKRVVAFPHTHYSVRKAAYILGLEYVETDYAKLASKVKNSDVIVVTLGTTETGAVDPLNEIAELASRRGAVVHVDAAYYGTILRHSNRVENIELGLDDTISTMAVDLHKIPEAPPPAGVLYARDEDILESLWFESPYLPGKRQFGLLGTRPGCAVYAASISLKLVVENWPSGPVGLARDLEKMVDNIVEELEAVGYRGVGGPAPIRCLQHEHIDRIIHNIEGMGYSVYKCLGRGIRIVAMPHHVWKGYRWMISILQRAATKGAD